MKKTGSKPRTQMPQTMFENFSTDVHSTRFMNLSFVRRLNESRSVKEGNSAFTKDQSTLEFCPIGKMALIFVMKAEYGVVKFSLKFFS